MRNWGEEGTRGRGDKEKSYRLQVERVMVKSRETGPATNGNTNTRMPPRIDREEPNDGAIAPLTFHVFTFHAFTRHENSCGNDHCLRHLTGNAVTGILRLLC